MKHLIAIGCWALLLSSNAITQMGENYRIPDVLDAQPESMTTSMPSATIKTPKTSQSTMRSLNTKRDAI